VTLSTLILLIASLVLLLLLGFFFAGSETSMMALNRYRLKHLAKQGNKKAQRALKLLDEPERLISMIITGNTCATIVASSILTFIATHYWGEQGAIIATATLTLVILFFCEALPKSIAALKPEAIALFSTYILQFFIYLFLPLVWVIHQIVQKLIHFFGIAHSSMSDHLSSEELHTLITESGSRIPENHQKMLLHILEMERLTVSDIMIQRQDLAGIDMDEDDDEVIQQLLNSPYASLPIFQKEFTEILGFVKIREVLPGLYENTTWSKENLKKHLLPAYIVPETTPLHKQLLNFRRLKKRIALVVDEYGEILGMITLEDLLEEIVGEFTTDFMELHPDIMPQKDGSFLINSQISLRELNRYFKWKSPLKGTKTLAGYLIAYLQMIPDSGTSVLINDHPVEILQVVDNRIKMVRLSPARLRPPLI
jgi:Mg2+/Co2+ transporter CorB